MLSSNLRVGFSPSMSAHFGAGPTSVLSIIFGTSLDITTATTQVAKFGSICGEVPAATSYVTFGVTCSTICYCCDATRHCLMSHFTLLLATLLLLARSASRPLSHAMLPPTVLISSTSQSIVATKMPLTCTLPSSTILLKNLQHHPQSPSHLPNSHQHAPHNYLSLGPRLYPFLRF